MPYWRLSSFYFFYFAVLGILVPYWGLYLKHLQFTALEIGQLMAIPMATKFIAPNVWGWLGDRYGHRMKIVRLASFISMVIFTLIFWVEGFWMLAAAMVLFSFFWNASLPQFEVVTLAYLGERVKHYSRVRAWGSVGFIAAVLVVGWLIDLSGIDIVPYAIFAVYISIWLASLTVTDVRDNGQGDHSGSMLSLLKRPVVIAFFAACFMMQFGHGVYYAFYSIYMESLGHSKIYIGVLWAIGVIAEILVFIFMHHLLHRFGAGRVLIVSLLLAGLRWSLIGWFSSSEVLLVIAQLLHAATFGAFHASAVHIVHLAFRGRFSGRGMAMYSSLSFGLGGALGSLMSGFMWESAGPAITFSVSAVVSLLAAFTAWRWHEPAYD
jgi:PPP family 3-phenylpropionic acid transporter